MVRETVPGVGEEALERMLVEWLATRRPRPRDLRDALRGYLSIVAGPSIRRSLAHTSLQPDEALVVRLAAARMRGLWVGSSSPWEAPACADLTALRQRIDRQYPPPADGRLDRIRSLLSDLAVAAVVTERLAALRRPLARGLQLIDGGGETSAPAGRLHVVRAEE